MRRSLLTVIVSIVINSIAFGCSCNQLDWANWSVEAVGRNIDNSELVIIAELVCNEEYSYVFRVKEVFKGEVVAGDTLIGYYVESCDGFPNPLRDKEWIFYGSYGIDNGKEYLSYFTCGLTRSLMYSVIYSAEEHIKQWEVELDILNEKTNKNISFQLSKK